jgi:putative intracellular protease/amidase
MPPDQQEPSVDQHQARDDAPQARDDAQQPSDGPERPSLLIVLTGADHWTLDDGTEYPTGFWAEELVTPMRIFRDAGVDVTLATPGGVSPTVDDASLGPEGAGGEEQAAQLRDELEELEDQLASPVALEEVSPEDFDGVFVPGGHGPMEDLAGSPELAALLIAMVDDDKVIAAVCHGLAALLSAQRDDGEWAFAGRDMTGFTNDEERQAGLADSAPWLLEDTLRDSGGTVTGGPAWKPFSVIDGNLVTGQNPASSREVAENTVDRLRARAHFVHVVPHQGTWTFKHEHGEAQGTFPTRKAAEQAAMEHARAHGDWEVVIHDRRGRIRDSEAVRPVA